MSTAMTARAMQGGTAHALPAGRQPAVAGCRTCRRMHGRPRPATSGLHKSVAWGLRANSSVFQTSSSRNQRALPSRLAAVATEVEELNAKYGIEDFVTVKEGREGLTTVVLANAAGAVAEVILFGGLGLCRPVKYAPPMAVSNWRQPSGDEVFYIRPDAKFDRSKPISGGVPHCFPQFGPGPMQQHGFARNLDWDIGSTSADLQPDERDPSVELVLTDSPATRDMWPHAFRAVYTVTLHGEVLRTELAVHNTGDAPFDFTAALHTYIEVKDIELAKVKGLKGLDFLDKIPDAANPAQKVEEGELVGFEGPVDRVYTNAPGYVELDVGTGAAVAISSSGWDDIVVWNPWEAMPCFREFCCVENAKFSQPAVVQPGEVWRATQEFAVIDLPGQSPPLAA